MFIDPTTAAATKVVRLKPGDTLSCRGAMGAYLITIEVPDGASDWITKVQDGVDVTLSADNNEITAYGETVVRVSKPTTGAVEIGVALYNSLAGA